MSSTEFNLNALLDDKPLGGDDTFSDESIIPERVSGVAWHESDYEGSIDYRIRQLSYSSLLTLHSCPRKFQLYKLRSTRSSEESLESSITFAFGHVVGEGIQLVFEGLLWNDIVWRLFLRWKPDLFAVDPKRSKSFWLAIIAVQRFMAMRQSGFLDEYELVYYNGKPATELSFCINFPGAFRLRGFVDAVLRNKLTGKIIVLECKTTGFTTVNPATYKNSAQGIGYSIVLDSIFPDLSSYEVLYLIYQTGSKEYTPIPFEKNYLQRAVWIRELLLDIEQIERYEAAQIYPMRGESCVSYGRDCEYLNVCTLSTEYLTKLCSPEEEDKTEYQVNLTLADLLTTQLEKTS